MICWFNGEKKDVDLSNIGGLEKILKKQKDTYSDYVGQVIGDFEVLSVEYDWGYHKHRILTKCVLCGSEDVKFLTFSAWKRGRNGRTKCECRKTMAQNDKKQKFDPASLVGVESHGWIVDGLENGCLVVRCTECGKRKRAYISEFQRGEIYRCNHKITADYSDPKWIGERNGHLTAVKHIGKNFDCVCDCGNAVSVKATNLFRYKNITSCGKSDCPFTKNPTSEANNRRLRGLEFEEEVTRSFKENGYNAVKTKSSSDFGVDVIVDYGKSRIAIQCKYCDTPSTVSSIQEVYAGGRYYECDRFAVISPSGYTENAIIFAAKLGVYCAVDSFDFDDLDRARDSCVSLLKTLPPVDCWKSRRAKTYDVNGESLTAREISNRYGIPLGTVQGKISSGMKIEDVINHRTPKREVYTVDGFTGNLQQIADRYGVLPQTIRYRMQYRGMSVEEAVKTPLEAQGRQRADA